MNNGFKSKKIIIIIISLCIFPTVGEKLLIRNKFPFLFVVAVEFETITQTPSIKMMTVIMTHTQMNRKDNFQIFLFRRSSQLDERKE